MARRATRATDPPARPATATRRSFRAERGRTRTGRGSTSVSLRQKGQLTTTSSSRSKLILAVPGAARKGGRPAQGREGRPPFAVVRSLRPGGSGPVAQAGRDAPGRSAQAGNTSAERSAAAVTSEPRSTETASASPANHSRRDATASQAAGSTCSTTRTRSETWNPASRRALLDHPQHVVRRTLGDQLVVQMRVQRDESAGSQHPDRIVGVPGGHQLQGVFALGQGEAAAGDHAVVGQPTSRRTSPP